jgi:divalent metal cation (Fe/Co/Zn/Cd) transporter
MAAEGILSQGVRAGHRPRPGEGGDAPLPGRHPSPGDAIQRRTLLQRGRRLEHFTLAWNALEAVVAVFSGVLAGSTALVGFGVDSLIESSSGAILLWRLRDGEHGEEREEIALRLVGVSFLALAAWVGWDAVGTLLDRDAPGESLVGIALAAFSLVVMPLLARGKRRVARGLGSRALEADSRQTDLCAYLSAILLVGLGLNAALGWWWADPVAGLAMVPIIGREGFASLRGERCADCHSDLFPGQPSSCGAGDGDSCGCHPEVGGTFG